MTYHVENGPEVGLILNERFKVKGTKLEGKRGRKLVSYPLADFTAIEGDDANVLGTPSNYNVVDNVPVLKSQAELEAGEAEAVKASAISEAEALYKTLSEKRVIDGYDLTNMFGFDFQRKKGGNVRMRKAGGKTESKTKAQTDAIEGKLYAYLNSCADALDADIDAIDSGDFSLANLKAL